MKKIVVLGRSGSGKDTFVRYLVDRYGMKQLISTTTRRPRYEGENTHVFVTKEEAALMTDRVAETEINGYEYFATRGQFEECDLYIIDPNGVKDLISNCPDQELVMVYVDASFTDRYNHAIERGDDPEKEREIFKNRNKSEDQMFSDLEWALRMAPIADFKNQYPTVKVVYIILNNGTIHDLYKKADEFYQEYVSDAVLKTI